MHLVKWFVILISLWCERKPFSQPLINRSVPGNKDPLIVSPCIPYSAACSCLTFQSRFLQAESPPVGIFIVLTNPWNGCSNPSHSNIHRNSIPRAPILYSNISLKGWEGNKTKQLPNNNLSSTAHRRHLIQQLGSCLIHPHVTSRVLMTDFQYRYFFLIGYTW